MAYTRWIISEVTTSVDRMAFLPPMAIAGIGLGIAFAALFQMVLSGVPHKDAGSASGALQAFQQAGGALGVALAGEIFFTWLEHARDWGATSKGASFVNAAGASTIYVVAVFIIAAALVPLLKRVPKPSADSQRAAPVVAEV